MWHQCTNASFSQLDELILEGESLLGGIIMAAQTGALRDRCLEVFDKASWPHVKYRETQTHGVQSHRVVKTPIIEMQGTEKTLHKIE